MNVSQLANTVYSNAGLNVNDITHPNSVVKKENQVSESTSTDFSKVLSDLISDDAVSSSETVGELLESLESLKQPSSVSSIDAMDILTDSERAKEYLSSQSGRQVIVEMAKNSIAEIISDSEN